MTSALRILSILTLVALAATIVGQILTYNLGIVYDLNGRPVDPMPLNLLITYGGAIGGILAMPLTGASFVLGLVATVGDQRTGWVVAIVLAGGLALVGLVAVAWVILSVASPIALQTPLVTIPVVTLLYSLSSPGQDALTPATPEAR